MRRVLAYLLTLAIIAGCAHSPSAAPGCHVESGWLDASNGCYARAGYPDCYQVCPDGSRTRLQNVDSGSPGGPPAGPQTAPH